MEKPLKKDRRDKNTVGSAFRRGFFKSTSKHAALKHVEYVSNWEQTAQRSTVLTAPFFHPIFPFPSPLSFFPDKQGMRDVPTQTAPHPCSRLSLDLSHKPTFNTQTVLTHKSIRNNTAKCRSHQFVIRKTTIGHADVSFGFFLMSLNYLIPYRSMLNSEM